MCQFFSGIIQPNHKGVWYDPFIDSHSEIMEKFKVRDNMPRAAFVKFEITPKDGDAFNHADDNWVYRLDDDHKNQLGIPEWYDPEKGEKQARAALKKVLEMVCVSGLMTEEIEFGRRIRWMRDSKIGKLFGRIDWMKNSQVKEMRESAQVGVMRESAQVGVMRESAQVGVMRESAQVGVMRGSAQVGVMWESAQVGVMWGSAQVKEMRGSAQVKEMWGSAQVKEMRESAQVGVMRESAQVFTYRTGKRELICPNTELVMTYENKASAK